VDFFDTNIFVKIRRTEGQWLIQITNIANPPGRNLSIIVRDDGKVDVTPGARAEEGSSWPQPRGNRNTAVKGSRPEEAFRIGVETLTKWKLAGDSLSSPGGRISFSRTGRGEWFLDASGYSGMPFEGFWVTVKDDGSVSVRTAM
jgi:hypothetical protein